MLQTSSGVDMLGAAMRGIAGGERLQHLACWRIVADQADKLREAAVKKLEGQPAGDTEFSDWALNAKVEWCRVLEDRPEIVERRDSTSASHWWHGKHVAILGCGAIGSAVAMILARAGIKRLQLYDNAIVAPGLLVRQNFPRRDIGYTKCSSLKHSVQAANGDLDVSDHYTDLIAMLGNEERLSELMSADAIIDATASISVASALEHLFRHRPKKHPPILSMCLGHNADFAMMTFSVDSAPGLSIDLDRKSKITLANAVAGRPFLEEFWPRASERRKLFQPEPGCSSPTFRGSFADVLGLVAPMTNAGAVLLAAHPQKRHPSFFGLDLSSAGRATRRARELAYTFQPDHVLKDRRHGYEIRLNRDASAAMLAWIRRSERLHGDRIETGGVLFGSVDEFLKVIWVDEVSGPPPDSIASPAGFLCGTAGVAHMHEEKKSRTGGSVSFIGMWHTHPRGLPTPSPTDLRAMNELLRDQRSYLGQRFLMIIVGGISGFPIISASVFQRSDYDS